LALEICWKEYTFNSTNKIKKHPMNRAFVVYVLLIIRRWFQIIKSKMNRVKIVITFPAIHALEGPKLLKTISKGKKLVIK
jgi:hypothetical protein